MPTVVSVNISSGGIPKRSVHGSVRVNVNGLDGDGHDHKKHDTPLRAVSLIDIEDLDDLRAEGFEVFPGATGENITLRELEIDALGIGDRLRFSGGVEIELTQARTSCYVLDAINPELKHAISGRCGYLAKVLRVGKIGAGESIEIVEALKAANRS